MRGKYGVGVGLGEALNLWEGLINDLEVYRIGRWQVWRIEEKNSYF